MAVTYIHLTPGEELPKLTAIRAFRAVVVVEDSVSKGWQAVASKWLVEAGCLYMMAWCIECSSWDDSVDLASLAKYDYKPVPEHAFVMTTWHESEPLSEAFWYAKNVAFHPAKELSDVYIVHVAKESRKSEILALFANA